MEWSIERKLSFSDLKVDIKQIGADYRIDLHGGDRPHIGSVVLSIPRPSLTGSGEISVTSSVLNVTGHKDEQICRYLAEQTARCRNAVVVCTGGFHVDDITEEQIAEVFVGVEDICREIKERLS